ncbi:MAG TPA: hypothetical protein VK600_00355 [Candidatus Saccharimonadales bacterium]|nr:hypothetical protein [Candidatus Saccharimonadales bacterium]
MSSSAARRIRRQYARSIPPRLCGTCRADLSRVIDIDSHIARHAMAASGSEMGATRRVVRAIDSGALQPALKAVR